MGADPIRPRAARHAVMAAYYQIAGAAERSLSPPSSEGSVASEPAASDARRQCSKKSKPWGQREPPSNASGARLPSSACRGQLGPATTAGLFFFDLPPIWRDGL